MYTPIYFLIYLFVPKTYYTEFSHECCYNIFKNILLVLSRVRLLYAVVYFELFPVF